MLQQLVTGKHQLIIREVPTPVCGEDQVLIQMMRVGVCGSDIHVIEGKHPFTAFPVTQGHEVSGVIAAVGRRVLDFRPGQKVTIEPQVVCGACYPCRHGKYNLCEKLKVMGFQTTGAASEYFAVDAKHVTLLPDSMSFDHGAMIEPVAVAVHAVRHAGDISGAKIIVMGAGPIGNLVAQAAKSMGAAAVMVTDISNYRLSLAQTVGVDFCVNTRDTDFGQAVLDAFGPDGADVIIDCAGNDITMGQAIRFARKGSLIILVAVFAKLANVDLALLNDHELTLSSSMMYRHEDYVKAISLVEEGSILLQPLISKHFSFADYLDAYAYIEENREQTMKVLIDIHP